MTALQEYVVSRVRDLAQAISESPAFAYERKAHRLPEAPDERTGGITESVLLPDLGVGIQIVSLP
jgi:hypothetical protein